MKASIKFLAWCVGIWGINYDFIISFSNIKLVTAAEFSGASSTQYPVRNELDQTKNSKNHQGRGNHRARKDAQLGFPRSVSNMFTSALSTAQIVDDESLNEVSSRGSELLDSSAAVEFDDAKDNFEIPATSRFKDYHGRHKLGSRVSRKHGDLRGVRDVDPILSSANKALLWIMKAGIPSMVTLFILIGISVAAFRRRAKLLRTTLDQRTGLRKKILELQGEIKLLKDISQNYISVELKENIGDLKAAQLKDMNEIGWELKTAVGKFQEQSKSISTLIKKFPVDLKLSYLVKKRGASAMRAEKRAKQTRVFEDVGMSIPDEEIRFFDSGFGIPRFGTPLRSNVDRYLGYNLGSAIDYVFIYLEDEEQAFEEMNSLSKLLLSYNSNEQKTKKDIIDIKTKVNLVSDYMSKIKDAKIALSYAKSMISDMFKGEDLGSESGSVSKEASAKELVANSNSNSESKVEDTGGLNDTSTEISNADDSSSMSESLKLPIPGRLKLRYKIASPYSGSSDSDGKKSSDENKNFKSSDAVKHRDLYKNLLKKVSEAEEARRSWLSDGDNKIRKLNLITHQFEVYLNSDQKNITALQKKLEQMKKKELILSERISTLRRWSLETLMLLLPNSKKVK